MTKTIHTTREAWLMAAIEQLSDEFFEDCDFPLPTRLRASCGFPKGGSGKAIGQCWSEECSKDGYFELFVSPEIDDPSRVLDVMLHELIHAAVGTEEGHKGDFKMLARAFGLEGPMRATVVSEGSELWGRLQVLVGSLGEYQHSAMTNKKKPAKENKWVRFVSTTELTYKCVINVDRVEEFGAPVDPWGEAMEPVNK